MNFTMEMMIGRGLAYLRKFYVYHSEFDYVAQDFGHQFLQSLEKIPGVLPSATYLAQIAVQSKADKPVKVLASISASLKNLEKFTELSLSGIGFIRLRLHPKVDEDYLDFYQNLIQQIENE